MEKKTLKIAIIGHVDHGKSTLIGRLLLDTNSLPKEKIAEIKRISRELGKEAELAFLTDQLKEERERNITIDTTQIFFKTYKKDYVIIDAPGHVEFIKNMLTGTTQAEAAVLIVDVNEGIMEQTRRHIYLANMLGIDKVIVVGNKMDLVGYKEEKFNEVKAELLRIFKSLNLELISFIPISAKEGDNVAKRSSRMCWYKGTSLLDVLDSFTAKREAEKKPMRFPVQDVYSIDNRNFIVGRIASGTIKHNQNVVILPQGNEAVIDAIEVFGLDKKMAEKTENIGIVLKGDVPVRRGFVISQKENTSPVLDHFKGHIFWMSDEPLETDKKVMVRCNTQEVECVTEIIEERIDSSSLEILQKNAKKLYKNEMGKISFRTKEPIVAEKFNFIQELGRFTIESNKDVCAAGIVV